MHARSSVETPSRPGRPRRGRSSGRRSGRCARPAAGTPSSTRSAPGKSFYEFSEDVESAAQASLCPRRFGVDAIILFYDITTLPLAMGLPFELKPGAGPVPDRPIRTLADLDRLERQPRPGDLRAHPTAAEAREGRTARRTAGDRLRRGAVHRRDVLHRHRQGRGRDAAASPPNNPPCGTGLLDKLSGATVGFLNTLIADGADVYQLFDSWAGMLTPDEYEVWAQQYHRTSWPVPTGVPRILFVKEGPYLDRMCASGADVISLGTRHDLAAARRDYPHLVFQGNVDEDVLRTGTPEQVTDAVRACVQAGGGQRHIVNLNHGVDKATPVANFEAYIRAVKS